MTTRLTVIIPCKDELPHIAACIASAAGIADELIVADSGSTDGTLELAKAHPGCRVIEREYVNSANFKNWAIPQATHDWILVVDADERVTPELAAEIQRLKESGELERTPHDAFSIARRVFLLNRLVRFSGWQHDRVRRLFRKSTRYETRRVHAELEVEWNKTGYLQSSFEHHTFRSLKHFNAKLDRYAYWSAEDLFAQGKRAGWVNLTLRPLFRFMKHYLFQLGILDGSTGLIISCSLAFSVYLKYAALWELECQATNAGGPAASSGTTAPKTLPLTNSQAQRRAA